MASDLLPTPGDLWAWPDGKLAFLTDADIVRGYVVTRYARRDWRHSIADGRRRTEPHILAIAAEVYGVSDVQ